MQSVPSWINPLIYKHLYVLNPMNILIMSTQTSVNILKLQDNDRNTSFITTYSEKLLIVNHLIGPRHSSSG
jgi:hypothetical protein